MTDSLNVATFNLHHPANPSDDVVRHWGREFGSRTQILFMQEAHDHRRGRLLAEASNLPSFEAHEDVAIASIYPLGDVVRHTVMPPRGKLASRGSYIIAARVILPAGPCWVVSTHWGIRDDDDRIVEAWNSAPYRVQAARKILEIIGPPENDAIVGGDLNAFSGHGPQQQPGATQEVTILRESLVDPFTALELPNEVHHSNARIDYVLSRSLYGPVFYNTDFFTDPSDHPFVLVEFSCPWTQIGHTNGAVAMTSAELPAGMHLFCATRDGRIWMRPPSLEDMNWREIGRLDGAVAMAAAPTPAGLKLFCATNGDRLLETDISPGNLNWQDVGIAKNVVAMAACGTPDGLRLFCASRENILWARESVAGHAEWQNVGHANNVVALAGYSVRDIRSALFCITSDRRFWMRDAVLRQVDWKNIGFGVEATAMAPAVSSGRPILFCATGRDRLWACDIGRHFDQMNI